MQLNFSEHSAPFSHPASYELRAIEINGVRDSREAARAQQHLSELQEAETVRAEPVKKPKRPKSKPAWNDRPDRTELFDPKLAKVEIFQPRNRRARTPAQRARAQAGKPKAKGGNTGRKPNKRVGLFLGLRRRSRQQHRRSAHAEPSSVSAVDPWVPEASTQQHIRQLQDASAAAKGLRPTSMHSTDTSYNVSFRRAANPAAEYAEHRDLRYGQTPQPYPQPSRRPSQLRTTRLSTASFQSTEPRPLPHEAAHHRPQGPPYAADLSDHLQHQADPLAMQRPGPPIERVHTQSTDSALYYPPDVHVGRDWEAEYPGWDQYHHNHEDEEHQGWPNEADGNGRPHPPHTEDDDSRGYSNGYPQPHVPLIDPDRRSDAPPPHPTPPPHLPRPALPRQEHSPSAESAASWAWQAPSPVQVQEPDDAATDAGSAFMVSSSDRQAPSPGYAVPHDVRLRQPAQTRHFIDTATSPMSRRGPPSSIERHHPSPAHRRDGLLSARATTAPPQPTPDTPIEQLANAPIDLPTQKAALSHVWRWLSDLEREENELMLMVDEMRTRPTSSRQRRRRSRSNGRYTGRPDRIALGIVAGTMSHHAPDQASSPSARPTASAFPSHSDSAASTTPRAASQPRSRPAPAAVSSEPDINIEAILAARADMLRYHTLRQQDYDGHQVDEGEVIDQIADRLVSATIEELAGTAEGVVQDMASALVAAV